MDRQQCFAQAHSVRETFALEQDGKATRYLASEGAYIAVALWEVAAQLADLNYTMAEIRDNIKLAHGKK